MLNKPAGVLSATEDRRQKTVLDLLPEGLRRRGLFPAGRLDKDTTGFLLITDDGELAHRNAFSEKTRVQTDMCAQLDAAGGLQSRYRGLCKLVSTWGEESVRPCKAVDGSGIHRVAFVESPGRAAFIK